MKIISVEITNIKGIQHHVFNLELIPNKPNILVAPNGFGKSSFCVAFQSLNTKRIELEEKNRYLNIEANEPNLILTIEDDGNIIRLNANKNNNYIQDIFDVFVINSQLIAKSTLLKFGGNSIAKSSMEIEPTILVNTIPKFVAFTYNHTAFKKTFGNSGKILPSINEILHCTPLLFKINNSIELQKFQQVKVKKSIDDIFNEIKLRAGTAGEIRKWISENKLSDLKQIEEFKKLAQIIQEFNLSEIKEEIDGFLAAFQIIDLIRSMGVDFRKASIYQDYLGKKQHYTEMIQAVNSTRIDIKPKEDKKKGCLVVEWPKAHLISNGQRDILSFMALLLKARTTFKKRDVILIIDEIFDYLDEGNLITFQYFITKMIEDMRSQGRNFFPILLTHLDPLVFNHFCFNRHKIKVVYLKDLGVKSNPNLLRLIRKREDLSIKASADKHHFHFHPINLDISTEFDELGLLKHWGESERFHQFISEQIDNYLKGIDYDPLAICIGLRVKVEMVLYHKITDQVMQTHFINTHSTKKKLDYCEQIGLEVSEYFYLLGIIYNDNLHLHNNIDITNPLAIKLSNLTIRQMIVDLFD